MYFSRSDHSELWPQIYEHTWTIYTNTTGEYLTSDFVVEWLPSLGSRTESITRHCCRCCPINEWLRLRRDLAFGSSMSVCAGTTAARFMITGWQFPINSPFGDHFRNTKHTEVINAIRRDRDDCSVYLSDVRSIVCWWKFRVSGAFPDGPTKGLDGGGRK